MGAIVAELHEALLVVWMCLMFCHRPICVCDVKIRSDKASDNSKYRKLIRKKHNIPIAANDAAIIGHS